MSSLKHTINEGVAGLKHGLTGNVTTHHSTAPTYTQSYSSHTVGGHHMTAGHASSGQYVSGHHGHSTHATHMGSNTAIVSSSTAHTRKISEVVKGDKLILPANAYEQSSRKVSSVVVYEEEEKIPEKNIRYVEVPQYEEVIKTVPIKEIREVEKVVPKIVEEWVERIVEIPQIEEVVRQVEVPQIEEVVKHVPKIEVVDRPYEVVKHVPKIEIQKIEKVIDVAPETIEVPKAVPVEERIPVTTYDDREAMLIISQKVKPVIIDGAKEVVVDVIEYEPEVMPVDIHVAKFVEQELVMLGAKETFHRAVTVPAAQYNSMLRFLNIHLSEEEIQNLPYLTDHSGQIVFLPDDYEWHAPQEGLKIYGYRQGALWGQGSVVATKQHRNSMTESEIRHKQAELDRQFQQIFQQFEAERNRRVSSIEEFNRQQEMKVRNIIGTQSHVGNYSSMGHSTSFRGNSSHHHAIGYPTHTPSSRSSIAYQAGHSVGSVINKAVHH